MADEPEEKPKRARRGGRRPELAEQPLEGRLESLLASMTPVQRAFAEATARGEVPWRAAQLAGCTAGGKVWPPEADLTGTEHAAARRVLSARGSDLKATKAVQEYIDLLSRMALARAGAPVLELAERMRGAAATIVEAADVKAAAIEVAADITSAELTDVASWDGDTLTVKPTEEWDRRSRRALNKIKQVKCPGCGYSHAGVEIGFETKAPYVALLAKLGEATRVEHSGPGGAPIQHEHGLAPRGLTRALVLATRAMIIGRQPPAADRT